MNVHNIDNKKTALLFFDMLNVYFHGIPDEKQKALKPVVDNAVRLMNAARQNGILIYYAMANHRPDGHSRYMAITDTDMRLRPWANDDCNPTIHGATEGSREQKVLDEIAPQPQDYIIPKYRWSTFHQTYFDLALRSRGIDTIIISGGSTDVGITSTMYSGRDLDYNMIVASDACGTSHDQRAHDMLMEIVFPRMARVRSTQQVIDMIQKAKS